MGTDIHGRVQMRWEANGKWEDECAIEDGRNYAVFAMLAGVRNDFGFAGCKTHAPLQPISEPRGLPDDNPEYKFEDWAFGDHSESWLTLREILDWPGWNEDMQMTGLVKREEYERIVREGGAPKDWCGDVWGQSVIKTTHEEVIAGTAPINWTDVRYSWTSPFRERANVFRLWIDYLEAKYSWLLERDPGAIRLVFGFDS